MQNTLIKAITIVFKFQNDLNWVVVENQKIRFLVGRLTRVGDCPVDTSIVAISISESAARYGPVPDLKASPDSTSYWMQPILLRILFRRLHTRFTLFERTGFITS